MGTELKGPMLSGWVFHASGSSMRGHQPGVGGWLWRFHCAGIIDEITWHWWLDSISGPSPLPRIWSVELEVPAL